MADSKFWAWLKKAVAKIGDWSYRYIGGLFMEQKDGKSVISIGRVAFMGVLGIMAWYWLFKSAPIVPEGKPPIQLELPDGLIEAFYALAGYVFGTKLVGALKSRNSNNLSK